MTITSLKTPSKSDEMLDRLLLRQEIEEFNAAYAEALDNGPLSDWPDFFAEEALYVITARENHNAGLPVGLVYCEGKGMLRDRIFAIENTAMFAPRYMRHFIANTRVVENRANGEIVATANYLLLQTLFDRPEAKLHQVGTYYDVFVRGDGALKLKERRAVYDNLLIDNSVVYPV
ncbi:MAG: aromatic-ring-hydroxylating dioxygenase subunit beta [Alphaproteobacteria bacterium]|nr:aromatic-ring-hydroxylating dioxygenase subunit beta [Alphaproteobacteria bacterium]MBU0887071.1 aromatic-ring-hydroxylating dioxygenase subunit beta [Alphaproteobacteria bacterium]MBU1814321.1 aromatic-ring-hydroxylating dioxygenase subunit beta [Alphaproteobacteria bacterium]MBU2091036.1 aromatic-ring-hydroxylating dioxygenase subunit beta [Alphaproteobacteria bacterium]